MEAPMTPPTIGHGVERAVFVVGARGFEDEGVPVAID